MPAPIPFSAYILALSQQLGIQVPAADDHNRCTFALQPGLSVVLHEDRSKGVFFLSSFVYDLGLHVKDRPTILAIALEANFFGQGTNGATFAFDRQAHQLVFFRTFALKRTSLPLFFKALEDLVFHAHEWRKRFETKDYYGKWRQKFRGLRQDTATPLPPDYWAKV